MYRKERWWQGGWQSGAEWLQRLKLKLVPEPQSRDSREMPVIGDENRSCFKGMGSDPQLKNIMSELRGG